jgi:endonuclease YncB( thermonuclease family)
MGNKHSRGAQPINTHYQRVNSLTDKPLTDKPLTDKPLTDKPLTDKPLTDGMPIQGNINSQLSLRSALVEVHSNEQLPSSQSYIAPADDQLQTAMDQIYTPRTPKISLMTINPESIPDVFCKDTPIQVYVYDVHDGDTVHFLMTSGPEIGPAIKLSLRLLGIDTPEIRGGQGHLTEEKIAGEMARDRLAELIGARVSKAVAQKPRKATLTTIIIRDWDKFGGRVLGEIILPDGRTVVNVMIAEGYGKPYHGEKKTPWTMEDLSKPPFKLI